MRSSLSAIACVVAALGAGCASSEGTSEPAQTPRIVVESCRDFIFESAHFKHGSSALDGVAADYLPNLAKTLVAYPRELTQVLLEGHASHDEPSAESPERGQGGAVKGRELRLRRDADAHALARGPQ